MPAVTDRSVPRSCAIATADPSRPSRPPRGPPRPCPRSRRRAKGPTGTGVGRRGRCGRGRWWVGVGRRGPGRAGTVGRGRGRRRWRRGCDRGALGVCVPSSSSSSTAEERKFLAENLTCVKIKLFEPESGVGSTHPCHQHRTARNTSQFITPPRPCFPKESKHECPVDVRSN